MLRIKLFQVVERVKLSPSYVIVQLFIQLDNCMLFAIFTIVFSKFCVQSKRFINYFEWHLHVVSTFCNRNSMKKVPHPPIFGGFHFHFLTIHVKNSIKTWWIMFIDVVFTSIWNRKRTSIWNFRRCPFENSFSAQKLHFVVDHQLWQFWKQSIFQLTF